MSKKIKTTVRLWRRTVPFTQSGLAVKDVYQHQCSFSLNRSIAKLPNRFFLAIFALVCVALFLPCPGRQPVYAGVGVFDGTMVSGPYGPGEQAAPYYVPRSSTVQIGIFKSTTNVAGSSITAITVSRPAGDTSPFNTNLSAIGLWHDVNKSSSVNSGDVWISSATTTIYTSSAVFSGLALRQPTVGASFYMLVAVISANAVDGNIIRLYVSTGQASMTAFTVTDSTDVAIYIDTAPPSSVGFSFLTVASATVVNSSGTATDTVSGLPTARYTISRSSENGNWYDAPTPLQVGWVSSHTWTGLIPNTTYQFRIQARDNVGNISVWSSTQSRVTLCNGNFTPSWGTVWISSATVTWGAASPDNPTGTKYIVQVSSDNFATITSSSQTIRSAGQAIVFNLGPNTTYYARVIARNWETVGSTSTSTSGKPTLCSPPAGVAWGTVSTTTIQISWQTNESPANPNNTIYLAQVSQYSDFSGAISSQTIKTGISVNFVNLSTNTAYYGRVIARNWETVGSTSTIGAPTSTSTLAALPLPGTPVFNNVTKSSITVNWQANGNPPGTDYQCQRSTADNFTGTLVSSDTKSNNAIFTGLTTGTSYWFQVKAINYQNISTAWRFLGSTSTLPANQKPDAPSSLGQNVGAGAWTNNQTPQVSFTQSDPDGDAMKFTVQFSTYNNFSYVYHQGVSPSFIASGQTTNYTPTPLPEATSWYWRVRSSDTASGYTSEWSTHSVTDASFRIDITPPTNVGCETPLNNAYDVVISTILYAKTATDALSGMSGNAGYKLRYSTGPTFQEAGTVEYGVYQAGTSWDPAPDLTPGVTYYWQVKARDAILNETTWYATVNVAGSTWSFRTLATPGTPTFAAAGPLTTTSIQWNWNTVATATTYYLYLATATTKIAEVVAPTILWNETNLSTNTLYGRRISAANSSGESALSQATTYYTLAAIPVLTAPTNVFTTSITVNWQANGNPSGTEYRARISTNTTFSPVFSTSTWATDTFATFIGLNANTTYYYQAQARNQDTINGQIETDWTTYQSTKTLTGVENTAPTVNFVGIPSQGGAGIVIATYTVTDAEQGAVNVYVYYYNGVSTAACSDAALTGAPETFGGSVSTGTNIVVNWNAKLDNNTLDLNSYLYILVNDGQASSDTTSGYFALDTKPAQIQTTTYLTIQPGSGQNSVSLRSDWIETNPNTSTFRARIDGSNYETAGSVNIAQATATISGLNLRGDSRITNLSSQLTDDYSNVSSWSIDTSTKYVRPLVPSTPTATAIWQTSMTIKIEPNLNDAATIYFMLAGTAPIANAFRRSESAGEICYLQWDKTWRRAGEISGSNYYVWASTGTDGWGSYTVTVTSLTAGTTYFFFTSAANPWIDNDGGRALPPDRFYVNNVNDIPTNSTSTFSISLSTVTKPTVNTAPIITIVDQPQSGWNRKILLSYYVEDGQQTQVNTIFYYIIGADTFTCNTAYVEGDGLISTGTVKIPSTWYAYNDPAFQDREDLNGRLRIEANDGAGGIANAYTILFNLDTKAPVAGTGASGLRFSPVQPISGSAPDIRCDWTDANLGTPQFKYYLSGTLYDWQNGDFLSGNTYKLTAVVPYGNDQFTSVQSQASDTYGNGPTQAGPISVYVQPQNPNQPSLSNVFVNSMTITFSSPEPAPVLYCLKSTSTAGIQYVKSDKTLSSVGDSEQNNWVSTTTWGGWSFVVTGFTGGTTYYISVKARNLNDLATQTAYSASGSACTQPAPNQAPQLSWINEPGYDLTDGVNPDAGVVSVTNFVYKVGYRDEDNNAPAVGYPQLQVSLNYSTWVYTMIPLGTPAYNTTYYYSLTLSNVTDKYQYRMVAKDTGSPPQTTSTNLMSGPIVGTQNMINVVPGTTTVYGVEGPLVNRQGRNIITLKSWFTDLDAVAPSKYYVTFKVSYTITGGEYTLVNNKTDKGLGELVTGTTQHSDVQNSVRIEQSGSTYTVTYAWDPSTAVPTGYYSLYFKVTDGVDLQVDGYANNDGNQGQGLYVYDQPIVITELPKGLGKAPPGKTVCQNCHTHRNRDWPHSDTRVPEYNCLTCHYPHHGVSVQNIRSTITAQITLTPGTTEQMTVIFMSTAPFINMGLWVDTYPLPPWTTGFGLVSVATQPFTHQGVDYSQGGQGPCQVCHIQAKLKYNSTRTLYYSTPTAINETHGGTERRCGQCHSHMPAPIVESVTTDPVYCSTMAPFTITINGKHFDMRIERSSDTSVQITHRDPPNVSTWTIGTTWSNATKLVTTVSTGVITLLNGATGWYNLSVYSPDGKVGTLTSAFEILPASFFDPPVISTFYPTSGSTGTFVTIGGSNFYSPVTVKFGTTTATVYWVSVNTVNAIVPNLPLGATTITLINSVDKSTTTTDLFTVTALPAPGAIPVITSISPNFGSAGAIFEITGSSFGVRQNQAAVKIYGDQYEQYKDPKLSIICDDNNEILLWTNNFIRVKIPSFVPRNILSSAKQALATPNSKLIVVSAEGSSSTVTTENFTLICYPPKVESIQPEKAAQGVSNVAVTVKGNYFSPGAMLYLEKSGEVFDIGATDLNLVNISTITAKFSFLVDQSTGDWRVIVRNPDLQEPKESLLFKILSQPVITSVVPNWSSSDTAKVVTISGSGFYGQDWQGNPSIPEIKLSTSANFTSYIPISSRTYQSATVIIATFPALTEYPGFPLGWYRIKITNADYYGVGTIEQGYKYEPVGVSTPPPSITSISPTQVYNNVNTTITISGANFIPTPTVKIGIYDAINETCSSSLQMKAVVPAGLPAGTTDVSVINFYGTVIASTATLPSALTIIKSAYACNDCHNAPATTGSHQKHYNSVLVPTQYKDYVNASSADKYKFGCAKCHDGVHQNSPAPGSAANPYQVEVFFDTSSAYLPLQVANATFNITGVSISTIAKQQTDGSNKYYAWRAGTCENLYCHGNLGANTIGISSAPAWATQWSGLTCNNCHKTDKLAGSSGSSHLKHVSSYTYTCNFCHKDYAANNTSIVNTANHLNGYVNMKLWRSTAVIGDLATYRTLESSAVIAGGPYGNCQNLYCHSSGTGSYKTIQWGAPSVNCGSCHNQPMNSGSHSKHISSPWNYACNKCHIDPNDGDRTKHVDHWINITTGNYNNGNPKEPGTEYTTCSSLPSCHGSGQPQWGTTLTCTDCHASTTDFDDYNFNNNILARISTSQWTNSKHKDPTKGNLTCTDSRCHNAAVQHGLGTNPFRLADVYLIQVDSGCKQSGCHTNYVTHSSATTGGHGTTNNWGNPLTAPTSYYCIDCHDPHGDSNTKGLQSAIARDSSDQYGKPSTADKSTKTITVETLAKATDYILVGGGGSEEKICQTCHQSNALYTISWGSATQHYGGQNADPCTSCHKHEKGFKATCTACHGSEATGQWWPANTGITTRSTNTTAAHQKHIDIIYARNTLPGNTEIDKKNQTCNFCHPNPGETWHNGGIPAEVTPLKYISGVADAWKTEATSGYDAVISTHVCYNSDCHAEKETPNWYNPTGGGQCSMCHSDPLTRATLAHTTHTAQGGLMGYSCTECHPDNYKVTPSSWLHLNGYVNMDFTIGSTQSIKTGSYSRGSAVTPDPQGLTGGNGSCNNIYCHVPNANSGIAWNETWVGKGWGGETRCDKCHQKPPTSGSDVHTIHNNGIVGLSTYSLLGTQYQFGCAICHNDTNNTTVRGDASINIAEHVRGVYYSGGSSTATAKVKFYTTFVGASAAYSTATTGGTDGKGFWYTNGTCNNTYCHGSELNANNAIDTSPNWNQGGWTCGGANSCHKTTNLPNVTGHTHGSHIGDSKQMDTNGYNYDCTRCHSGTDTPLANTTPERDDRRYHVNKAVEKQFDSLNPGGY